MILYGYRMNDYDNLLRLSQAELSCSQEELKKIIQFLEEKKEEHLASEKEFGQAYCSSHYRDWDSDWLEDESDFILVTGTTNQGRVN